MGNTRAREAALSRNHRRVWQDVNLVLKWAGSGKNRGRDVYIQLEPIMIKDSIAQVEGNSKHFSKTSDFSSPALKSELRIVIGRK